MIKKLSLRLQSVFYFVAGLNHFLDPNFYLSLIPKYLGDPIFINHVAGVVEIAFAIGLRFSKTRRLAIYGIILMLIAFIPSHMYFIQIGGCVEGSLCVPVWVGWFRLLIIHPLLIYWAWYHRRDEYSLVQTGFSFKRS